MPQELVRHWNPAQPLLAGGLEGGEEARSHLQLRLKRHRCCTADWDLHWVLGKPTLMLCMLVIELGRMTEMPDKVLCRWHAKILKSRDPLVFSMGWRRFQSMPVFATEDANGRLRYSLIT